jgi:hypothetical protein
MQRLRYFLAKRKDEWLEWEVVNHLHPCEHRRRFCKMWVCDIMDALPLYDYTIRLRPSMCAACWAKDMYGNKKSVESACDSQEGTL